MSKKKKTLIRAQSWANVAAVITPKRGGRGIKLVQMSAYRHKSFKRTLKNLKIKPAINYVFKIILITMVYNSSIVFQTSFYSLTSILILLNI